MSVPQPVPLPEAPDPNQGEVDVQTPWGRFVIHLNAKGARYIALLVPLAFAVGVTVGRWIHG